jgi:hypothetical protein
MFIVWRGGGAIIFVSLVFLSFGFNLEHIHYSSNDFDKINWWLPLLTNALFTFYWSSFCERMNRGQTENVWLSNLFESWGKKHTLYWIDIKYWGWIFLGLGLYVKFHT